MFLIIVTAQIKVSNYRINVQNVSYLSGGRIIRSAEENSNHMLVERDWLQIDKFGCNGI